MRQEEGKIKLKGDKVKTSWEEWLGASGRGENVWLVSKMRDRNEGNESPLGRDKYSGGLLHLERCDGGKCSGSRSLRSAMTENGH